MEIEELEKKRDKEITGFFWLGLQIAFIFGIPAFLAVLINKIIENKTENSLIVVCLATSFIFSWIIVIILYNKKAKKLNGIETELKELKNNKK